MSIRTEPWPAGTPNWVDISVPNVDAALAFYGPVLGWTFHDAGAEYGGYRVCMAAGHSVAGIGPCQENAGTTAWLVYLASDDVDATAKLVTDNGGQVVAGPFDVPEVGRLAVATDSTGGAFGVFQAGKAIGTELVDEPGSLVWEDARLTDVTEGRRFYAAVFGYSYQELPGMAFEDYGLFGAADRPWGGMAA